MVTLLSVSSYHMVFLSRGFTDSSKAVILKTDLTARDRSIFHLL